MKPIITIVGRPNVGKSTLFNRLTKSKKAIIGDIPGLTIDRNLGEGKLGFKAYFVIDTGGFELDSKENITMLIARQTKQAIDESDIILFVVDGQYGINNQDIEIAKYLRSNASKVYVLVNKTEGLNRDLANLDFYQLGFDNVFPISAIHGDNVGLMIEEVLANVNDEDNIFDEDNKDAITFAVIGRPNVGKSTLVNSILGEDRVVTFDKAGTTKDSIHIDFVRDEKKFCIIDTAGMRRSSKIDDQIEKYSIIKTIKSIELATIIVIVIDASQNIVDQDISIAALVLKYGKSVVIVVNKWDLIPNNNKLKLKEQIKQRLYFLDYAKIHYISALKNKNINSLFNSIEKAYNCAYIKLSTPKVTRVLQAAIEKQAPAKVGQIRPKMRYAHQGGMNPPTIIIHGNTLEHVKESYTRYLISTFIKAFNIEGTPIKIEYVTGKNPYKNKPKKVPRRAALSNRIAKKEEKKALKNKIKKHFKR